MLKSLIIFYVPLLFLATSCEVKRQEAASSIIEENSRVVSLSGTLTEMVCALGFEKNLIGADITSTFPESMQNLPKVGHNKNISSEGIISLHPDFVMAFKDELKPELIEQIKAAGIHMLLFDREYSVSGTIKLFSTMADTLGVGEKAGGLIIQTEQLISKLIPFEIPPRVLFIYARGAGTLMVAGENTAVDRMIQLSGGENAVHGFEDYKPLTPEALVAANPDVILMYSSGLESLKGNSGLLAIPGISETTAGKRNAVIEMDGQYLSGFGPRLGQAVLELNQKLHQFSPATGLVALPQ